MQGINNCFNWWGDLENDEIDSRIKLKFSMYGRLSSEKKRNKGDYYYLLLLSLNSHISLLRYFSLSHLSFNNYNNQHTNDNRNHLLQDN